MPGTATFVFTARSAEGGAGAFLDLLIESQTEDVMGIVVSFVAACCQRYDPRLRYSSPVDILKMLAELRQERAQVEEGILVLQRLSLGQGKRRGRPPG